MFSADHVVNLVMLDSVFFSLFFVADLQVAPFHMVRLTNDSQVSRYLVSVKGCGDLGVLCC